MVEEGLELMTRGDDNDIFGKWAWPHDRNDGDPSTENEEDTSPEAAAYSALRKLVDSNVAIDEEDSRVIMAALRSGKYRDVLRPPPPGVIYRGMSVPRGWLMRALNVSYEEEDLVAPEGESSGATFTFTPRNGESSSWSLSGDMAVEYSRRTHSSGWSIVMTAQVDPDTMICGPGGFYRVKGLDEYVAEDEVIAFGPVKVTHLRWKKIT